VESWLRGEQVQSVGKTLRGSSANGDPGRRAIVALGAAVIAAVFGARALFAQEPPERLDRGRFTAVFYPTERTLATSLLDGAVRTDTFPGLPRPTAAVLLELAPDKRRFREWVGPGAPEWGAAITFPEQRRIVMQGRSSGSDAGVPSEVFRHELAHLALHEFLGDLAPRWFDEGYASFSAREWTRDDALAANLGLALRGTPTLDELDQEFSAGTMTAQMAYALSYRAVVELASLDPSAGLTPLLAQWRKTQSLDRAIRGSYGVTLADFELRWRDRTRRRYGALALVSDATLGGLIMLVVVFPLYVARRQRDRRRLAELKAADEAADRAARASIIEALLRGDDLPDVGAETPPPPPS
jgi:hypothetical protein